MYNTLSRVLKSDGTHDLLSEVVDTKASPDARLFTLACIEDASMREVAQRKILMGSYEDLLMQPFKLDAFRSITGMLMGRLAVDKHFILCDQLKRCVIDELAPIAVIDSFPDEVLARAASAARSGLHILHLPFKKASPPPQ